MTLASLQRVFITLMLLFAVTANDSPASSEPRTPAVESDAFDGYVAEVPNMESNDVEIKWALSEDVNDGNMNNQRKLPISTSTVPCNGGAGPIINFTLDFNLTPQGGWNLNGCTVDEVKRLENAINAFLLDYGIGEAGEKDKIAFLARVCNVPVASTGNGRDRELTSVWNFRFVGGGACRFCSKDNFDYRRRALRGFLKDSRRLQTSIDPNWFQNVFKPQMQNTLRNAFSTSVAPLYKECLGNGPSVDPIITKSNNVPNYIC